jgi:hypothetical protein
MSVQYDKNQPGFEDFPILERSAHPDGLSVTYFMVVVVKPKTQITLSFGPVMDDEEAA